MNRTLKTQLFQGMFAIAALGAMQVFDVSALKESPVVASEGPRVVMQQQPVRAMPLEQAGIQARQQYGEARVRQANEPQVDRQPQVWDRLPQSRTYVF